MTRKLQHPTLPGIFEEFIDRKLKGFIGRDWLLRELKSKLESKDSSSGKTVVLIKGDPGIGKSTSAARLIASWTCKPRIQTLSASRQCAGVSHLHGGQ